jgi:signal transduction histidine kinase
MATLPFITANTWRPLVHEAVELLRDDAAAVASIAAQLEAQASPIASCFARLLVLMPPLFTRESQAVEPFEALAEEMLALGDTEGEALALCAQMVGLRPQVKSQRGWAIGGGRLAHLISQIELSSIRVLACNACAVTATDVGRIDDAARLYYAALDDARQLGLIKREAHIRANIGELLYVCGNADEAAGMLDHALELLQDDHGPWLQTYVRSILALCRLTLGQADAAYSVIAQVLPLLPLNDGELAHKSIGHWSGGFACAAGALVLAEVGQFEAAERCAAASHRLFAGKRAPQLGPYAWWATGRCQHVRGQLDEALQSYERAIASYDDAGYVFLPMRVSLLMYQIHRQRGDFEAALALHERYHQLYDKVQSQATRTRMQVLDVQNSLKSVQQTAQRQHELAAMKGKIIAMASHEFRTPLAVVQSTAELLRHYHHRMPEQERVQVLDDMQRSVDRLKTTMEQVLFLAKSDAGKVSTELKPLNWHALASEVIADVKKATADRNPIEFSVEDDVVRNAKPLLEDTLLRQALANLLSNACKYSNPEQSVVLRAHMDNAGHLSFEVSDRGMGIPQADQARLFGSFERASNAEHIQGTGLGLVIVQRSAQLLGGSVAFESVQGQGSRFVLNVPLPG